MGSHNLKRTLKGYGLQEMSAMNLLCTCQHSSLRNGCPLALRPLLGQGFFLLHVCKHSKLEMMWHGDTSSEAEAPRAKGHLGCS